MDFDEFWCRLSVELESTREFETLKQSKAFKAIMKDSWTVTVTPESSGKKRSEKKYKFQQMWDMMKSDIRSKRYVGSNGRYKKFWNPVYVCALIDYIVGDQDMQ